MKLNKRKYGDIISLSRTVKAVAGCILGLGLLGAQPAAANSKYAALVYDVNSGRTLFNRHADKRRYPASLTKMMTLYVLFEEMEAGRLTLRSQLTVSRTAASRPPSKLGLRPGSKIAVKSAILSLVTKSANDIAATIAENISGSEANFGKRMTRTARRLGMKSTTFRNASGLPDSKQHTTARDMMRLGMALQKNFPVYYRYFNTTSFKYGGRSYRNHNKLLRRVKGVDGIKTGYTRASGFNLVANVRTGNRHIIAVVMGGKTGKSRDAHMRKLIAQYLPKAKRRRGGSPLMASASHKMLNGVAPRPLTKPRQYTHSVAAVVPTPSKPVPLNAVPTKPAPVEPAAGEPSEPVRLLATAYTKEAAKLKLLNPVSNVAPNPKAAPSPKAGVAHVDTISSRPDGWLIQIGAVPSKSGAEELLGSAQEKAKKTLKNTNAFTETIEKGGLTLHRARFAGFDNKASAYRACKVLKKKKFACLALPPQ